MSKRSPKLYLDDIVNSIYPALPWKEMVSMRNKVLHEYFGIDMEILWKTIKEDLPDLKEKIKAIRERCNQIKQE